MEIEWSSDEDQTTEICQLEKKVFYFKYNIIWNQTTIVSNYYYKPKL